VANRTKLDERVLEEVAAGIYSLFTNKEQMDKISRGHWPMGRVTGVSPGADAVVRVAMVRTAHGLLKRPVAKLAKISL
jgi:Family of unknown function (DUF5641)